MRSRTTLVAVLLSVTLALTALLAVRVVCAVRSHRTAAEYTLRDYSSFAAAEMERRVRRAFEDAFFRGALRAAQSVNSAAAGIALPSPRILADTSVPVRGFDVRKPSLLHGYFLLHLADSRLEIDGNLSEGEQAVIKSRARTEALAMHDSGVYYGVMVDAHEAPSSIISYLIKSDAAYRPTALYGVVVEIDALKPLMLAALSRPLLPRLAAGLPNDSALTSRVLDATGNEVFRSRPNFDSTYASSRALGMQLGALTIQVAARSDAASSLVQGGLPDPRAWVVFSPVVLCALLLGVALLLLRRESELARMRNDFVANVSHELRTPLAQIRMFSETLLLGRVRSEAERTRSLEIVNHESTRLTNLVENLLHFSRGERGAERLAVRKLDIAQCIHDVITAFEPLASDKNTVVCTDAAEGIFAESDSDAIRQMLLNLLDNALKYGPPGQTIRVGASANGARVLIHVDDEGPGVAAGDRERIFARFARASEHRDANTGTGIGLAVVAELANRLGGSAWVERAPNGGARFVLALRRASERS